jgi:hypothetical protein
VGKHLATGSSGPNQVWVSPDGTSWTALPADAFGATSVVVSVAAIRGGVAALTLELGKGICDEPPDTLECHLLGGPLQAWTSADGTTWAAHPVTGVPLPAEMTGSEDDHPVFESAVTPLLLVRSDGRWQAVSDDGVTWDRLAAGALPRGWRVAGASAFSVGYLGTGAAGGKAIAVSSTDGRTWTPASMRTACGAPNQSRSMLDPVAAGADGILAQGSADAGGGVEQWLWCASGDGQAWKPLGGYPPLGAWKGHDECRDVCPDGIVVADGERFLAYRGFGKQAAWTSTDGRTWEQLTVAGTPPTGWVDATYPFTMDLLPIGLLAQDGVDNTAWLGALGP